MAVVERDVARKAPPWHVLTVAADCLATQKGINPILVDEVRELAERETKKDRTRNRVDHNRLVERQRSLWNMLPDTTAKQRLLEAMLSRAWELLDCGQCEACDALLEFLPSEDAERMLRKYFPDEFPDNGR